MSEALNTSIFATICAFAGIGALYVLQLAQIIGIIAPTGM